MVGMGLLALAQSHWVRPFYFLSNENFQIKETYDGKRIRDHLNLIFPVYFDLMSRYPSFYSEGSREIFLH